MPNETLNPTGVSDLMSLARERFKLCEDAEYENRKEMLVDKEFRVGDQWDKSLKASRESEGKPCLTVDRTSQFIRQVTNEQRRNRPSIVVLPVGAGEDIEEAEVRQGICRHIEVQSDADTAYSSVTDDQVTCGIGWCRLIAKPIPGSWDQEIYIEPIYNTFSVYCDPAAQKVTREDAEYMFVIEDMSISRYKREYPDSELAALEAFDGIGTQAPGWMGQDFIRVAEYFRIELEKATLCLLDDDSVVYEDELPEGAVVVKRRTEQRRRVKWSKINGIEELDREEIPGEFIPLFPAIGEEVIVDGKRYIMGLTRRLRDPQRIFNAMNSNAVETIALAPRNPWVIAEGQIEGHEAEWQQANHRNIAALTYKPQSLNGTIVGQPFRQQAEPPIQAMMQTIQLFDNNMKASVGIYDASLGQKGPEQSGRAILARQEEGDTATYHFIDNLSKMIRHLGRVILDWLPYYYDARDVVRITRPDESTEEVPVNQPAPYKGQIREFDLSKRGKYAVTVTVGPSYQSKRQQATEQQLGLLKVLPQVGQVAPDIMVANMDIPEAQEIAKRLKKTLPPGVLDEGGEMDPQVAQQQLQQSGQMIDQLTQQLNALSEEVKTQKVQTDSKERIEMAKLEQQSEEMVLKYRLELAKLGEASARFQLEQEVNAIERQTDLEQRDVDRDIAAQQAEQQMAADQAAQQQEVAQ